MNEDLCCENTFKTQRVSMSRANTHFLESLGTTVSTSNGHLPGALN